MQNNHEKNNLSMKIRVVIGFIAIPSLLLAAMLLSMILNGEYADIGFFELIYSIVGFVAAYMAVTGKKLF